MAGLFLYLEDHSNNINIVILFQPAHEAKLDM